jgi:hypothetical protein
MCCGPAHVGAGPRGTVAYRRPFFPFFAVFVLFFAVFFDAFAFGMSELHPLGHSLSLASYFFKARPSREAGCLRSAGSRAAVRPPRPARSRDGPNECVSDVIASVPPR